MWQHPKYASDCYDQKELSIIVKPLMHNAKKWSANVARFLKCVRAFWDIMQ